LKLHKFRFGFLQDGDVWVGVFPKREEILILSAGLGRVTLYRVGASQLKMGQRADGFIQNNAAMVDDFLKLCPRFAALMSGKIESRSHGR
jgi:hypothetical protein